MTRQIVIITSHHDKTVQGLLAEIFSGHGDKYEAEILGSFGRQRIVLHKEQYVDAQYGKLAARYGYRLPIQVLHSASGHYLGTYFEGPVTRESMEYWPEFELAMNALRSGEWQQRTHL